MKRIEFVFRLLPILFPAFYSVSDCDGNEFVFLDMGDKINDFTNKIEDKTSVESIQNHFHLFERQNKNCRTAVYEISTAIAKNLLNSLKCKYPDKEFIVFLDINMNDSTIVRFHQQWKDEIPYYDITQLNQKGFELYEFRTS